MSYETLANLKAAIPPDDLLQYSDLDRTGNVDDARLQQALDDASAEINGYISRRVALPLADPPQALAVACRDLAVYRLQANIGRVTDTQEGLRSEAMKYLAKIADGDLAIGDDVAGNEQQIDDGPVMTEGPERVMTRDALRHF